MKRYFPAGGPITHNGVRQYLEEDLGLLLEYVREIAHQEAIVRLTEDNATRKHVNLLRARYGILYREFLEKWNK